MSELNITHEWKIKGLSFDKATGRVLAIRWCCTSTCGEESIDRENTFKLSPTDEVSTPLEELTEEIVLGWLWNIMGEGGHRSHEQKNEGILKERLLVPETLEQEENLPWGGYESPTMPEPEDDSGVVPPPDLEDAPAE